MWFQCCPVCHMKHSLKRDQGWGRGVKDRYLRLCFLCKSHIYFSVVFRIYRSWEAIKRHVSLLKGDTLTTEITPNTLTQFSSPPAPPGSLIAILSSPWSLSFFPFLLSANTIINSRSWGCFSSKLWKGLHGRTKIDSVLNPFTPSLLLNSILAESHFLQIWLEIQSSWCWGVCFQCPEDSLTKEVSTFMT